MSSPGAPRDLQERTRPTGPLGVGRVRSRVLLRLTCKSTGFVACFRLMSNGELLAPCRLIAISRVLPLAIAGRNP
jgi:hypothetical protein